MSVLESNNNFEHTLSFFLRQEAKSILEKSQGSEPLDLEGLAQFCLRHGYQLNVNETLDETPNGKRIITHHIYLQKTPSNVTKLVDSLGKTIIVGTVLITGVILLETAIPIILKELGL